MILAEALAIRKDLQKKIEQLRSRLLNNVRIQEGDEPSENPTELLKELDSSLTRLQRLIFQINKTNMNTVSEGKTLTELMSEKDVLTLRTAALREVFNKASESQDRYSRSEIKMTTTIDVKALGRQIDEWAKQLRQLDIKIQSRNFSTELAD